MILDNEDLVAFLVHGALSGLSQGVHTFGAQTIARHAVDVAQLALVELQARGLIHSAKTSGNGATISPVARHTGVHQFVQSPFAEPNQSGLSSESKAPRNYAPPPVMPGTYPQGSMRRANPNKVFEGAPLANPLSAEGPLAPMRVQKEPIAEESLNPLPQEESVP